MKKTVYLAILTGITIICILAGILYHGRNGLIRVKSDFWVTSEREDFIHEDIAVDAFAAIAADMDTAQLYIQTGDGFTAAYEGDARLKPDISVVGNTLRVTSKRGIMHINSKSESNIIITVPEGAVLQKIDIDIDAGNIRISGVDAEELGIDVDAGNVEVYDGVYTKVEADVDAGNISFGGCTLTKCEADADMGKLELDGCSFDVLNAAVDMGDIEISSTQSLDGYTIDIEMNLGRVTINGTDHLGGYHAPGDLKHRIELKVDLGNATLSY